MFDEDTEAEVSAGTKEENAYAASDDDIPF
jgi:hypothetical protein